MYNPWQARAIQESELDKARDKNMQEFLSLIVGGELRAALQSGVGWWLSLAKSWLKYGEAHVAEQGNLEDP